MPKHPLLRANPGNESIKPSDDIFERLKSVQNARHVLGDVEKVCTALEGSTQLAAVKRVGSYLNTAVEWGDVPCLCIEVLVDLYFRCPTKLSLKRLITSCLNGANPALQSEVLFIVTNKTEDVCRMEENNQVTKLDVDNLLMLLDTLKLVENCLEPIVAKVLGFLAHTISQSSQRSRGSIGPIEKNDAMQICLKTVQAINKILQKFQSTLAGLFSTGELSNQFRQIMKCIKELLLSEYFLLDCQGICGMTVPLLFNIMYGQSSIAMISSTILEEDIKSPVAALFTTEVPIYNSLSTSSQICLLHGITTALSTSDLTKDFDGKSANNLLITAINKVMLLSEKSVDANANYIRSRCLVAWTAKACQCLADQPDNLSLKSQLNGQQEISKKILSYLWMHWEDPIESVRHQARIVFENTILMHLKATGEDPKESNFVKELGVSLLNIPWTSKGKFGPLCSLVDHLGAEKVLLLSPTLPCQLLTVISDLSYANNASGIYDKLATISKEECGLKGKAKSEENMLAWQQKWIEPVLEVLCQGERTQKSVVMEYILPKLLKNSPESLKYITRKMSTDSIGLSSNNLCALMTCLKKARTLGHIQQKTDIKENNTMWNDVVPLNILQTALIHKDDQIRLDSLGLIVENPKICEIISEQDLDLVKSFLPRNLSNQSPAFRQQLISLLKRLFFRLRESGAFLLRNLSSTGKKKPAGELKKTEETLQYYKNFLKWLCDFLFTSLYPGVCFPRRCTVLSIFTTLLLILEDEKGKSELFSLPDHVTPNRARSLIECLTDTFEDCKKQALNILLHLPSQAIGFDNKDTIKEYYDVSTELICTTKPQDCGTAAYLLQLLINQDQFYYLVNKNEQHIENTLEGRQLLCLNELLKIYQNQLGTAKISLLHASATRPIYPVLHCIRYILATIDLKHVVLVHEWRGFLELLIQACFDLTAVVSPVISHSSPEGNVPIESFLEGDQAPSKDIEESIKLVQEMPQYLIVCCWRSIKEISLLLGQLTLTAPIHCDENQNGMLSCELLCSLGDFFISLLLESRHRGAFELAYAGFVSMCQMLWSCPISSLHVLPKQWLKQIMLDVKESNSTTSRLCATRRSAGVPFYVQALISTEPASSGKLCFKEAMAILIELALSGDTEKENIPKVHALNILRTLFIDNRLSDNVLPFIADGVKAAILGFLSQDWAIRNSATLLFSAVMTRIFGVPREKDGQNRKNCLSGRVFFYRFPSVFPFLLEQLELAEKNIGGDGQYQLHPGLYPVLMMLGRLLPSVLEGKDSHLNLGDFIPYVVRCANSPVFKTRLMAARALRPLVSEEYLVPVMMDLISNLPTEDVGISHNKMHGILLQLDGLLQNAGQASHKLLMKLSVILPKFSKTTWIATSTNKDYVTRAAYLTTLQGLLCLNWPEDNVEGMSCLQQIRGAVIDMLPELECTAGRHQLPGYVDFLCALGNILISLSQKHDSTRLKHKVNAEELYLNLISSESYELRLLGLREMKKSIHDNVELGLSNSAGQGDVLRKPCNGDLQGNGIDCNSVMITSSVILDKLICMVLKEERHPECLVHVLEALSVHSKIQNCPWKVEHKTYTSLEVLQWLIELSISHSVDEVRCAALRLTRILVPALCRSIQPGDKENDVREMLQQWTALLCDASQDQRSLNSRLASAEVILHCHRTILIDRDSVLDDVPLNAWSVVIKLLQDDDVTVRETAADVVINVLRVLGQGRGRDSSYRIIQPEFALDIAMQLMIVLFCWRNWMGCFQTLISWTTGEWERTANNDQDQEESLFDKGELNTYEDAVTFTQKSVTYMCSFLMNSRTSANQPVPQDTHKGGLPKDSPGLLPEHLKLSNQSNVWHIVAKVIPTVLKGNELKLPASFFPAVSNDHMTVYDTYGGLSLLLDDKLSLLTTVQRHAQVIFDFPAYSRWVMDIYRILTTLVTLRGSLEKSGNIVADSTWDVYDQTLSKIKDEFAQMHNRLFEEALAFE